MKIACCARDLILAANIKAPKLANSNFLRAKSTVINFILSTYTVTTHLQHVMVPSH